MDDVDPADESRIGALLRSSAGLALGARHARQRGGRSAAGCDAVSAGEMVGAQAAGMDERTIERAYRMRAYPTPAQQALLGRLLGATRYVWNWALERRSRAWREREERMNWITLSADFTALRRSEGTAWLAELPREPFNQVLRDQDKAFANFFAKRARHPRFKRKRGHASMRFTLDQRRTQVRWGEGRWAWVSLPGLGEIKLRCSEDLVGRLRSVTLRCDGGGRWHASLTADRVPAPATSAAGEQAVGVDAGLRELLVVAGDAGLRRVAAPKSLARKQAKLRRYQRRQSRQIAAQMRAQGLDPSKPCPKGVRLAVSNRRRRVQRQIGRLHGRIADVRREALHQATIAVVRESQVICIEDLAVQAMSRGMGRKAFRRSVADASLGEVRRQLEYKSSWHGRTISVVGRFYPSSKTCSGCGAVHSGLRMEKHWSCPHCGQRHDRDENAARNIRSEGLRLLGAASSPATPRSGGSDARGEVAAAPGKTAPAGLPTSEKREPTIAVRRQAPGNGTKARARPPEPCLEQGEGGSG